MFAILIYDISTSLEKEKKNYYRVCKTVEKYLQRVQYSVFEGELQPHELKELKASLKKTVNKNFDSIIIYTMKSRKFTEKIEIGVEREHPLFS
jgi:CRISPR-associated protein Cas2